MTLSVLIWVAALLAGIPCLLFILNLVVYRRLAPSTRCLRQTGPVSVLIPARNEEQSIEACLQSVLANTGIEYEVIVLDDHSEDETARIVEANRDARVRLAVAPALPSGWCGKQHACHVLAGLARHPLLLFIDADVRLAPDALSRLAGFMGHSGADLVSGVPRQQMGTFFEGLLLPLIHFLLLGFLPIFWMRRTRSVAFGAGCGQLFMARADAYRQCGGHSAIRDSLHDGLKLPRVFRQAGLKTDLVDATDLGVCRMYRTNAEVWQGLGKNAVEGLAAPVRILPMTILLFGGQVLPFLLFVYCVLSGVPHPGLALALVPIVYVPRVFGIWRFRQPLTSALLHPLAVLVLLAIQWLALGRRLSGRPSTWKGRSYTAGGTESCGRIPDAQENRPGLTVKTTKPLLIASLLLTSLVISSAGGQGHARSDAPQAIASFELADQFEQVHRVQFPTGKVTVLVVANRKGADEIDSWVKPLVSRFGSQIEISGIADMSSVPALLRPMVRKRFGQERRYPVMMDWRGQIAAKFLLDPQHANVFVLAKDGRIVWQHAGKASIQFNALFSAVDHAMREIRH